MKTNIHFGSHLVQFFLEWEMFKKCCRENPNTRFMINNIFENRAVYETIWKKYCRAGQSTGDNMAHAHCRLNT